jgi:hypothetical protein
MNKKLNLLVMLVSLLALSLVFGSCDNGTGGGGTGTFRIKVTDIPSDIMAAGNNGQNLIAMFPANTTTYGASNALAGRDTALTGDDSFGSDWCEFSMYSVTTLGLKYTGPAGNYDIGFINKQTLVGKVSKNTRLEVNQTNTFSYNVFQDL